MSHHPTFTIAALGFDERERVMLRDLLRLSEHRAPTFRVFKKGRGELLPHILLVNADAPPVLAKWRSYRKAHGGRYRCADVLLSTRPIVSKVVKYIAKRPIAVSQLMSLFDRAVVEEHGYRPAASDWRPPFVLSSQEHALFLSPQPSAARVGRPAPAPVSRTEPRELAVIMEPTDSNATTMSARAILDAAAEARLAAPAEQRSPVAACKARILVVDANLSARVQMKAALEPYATVIDFADAAEQAMRMLDRTRYDVVFLDAGLPNDSGYEVCRWIRLRPLQKDTPVVMVSGAASAEERAAGARAGANAYLAKPVRQTVLTEIISDFIRAPRAA